MGVHYSDSTLVLLGADSPNGDQSLTVRALCLHAGEFTALGGTQLKVTAAKLKAIADASNQHLSSGVQVPFFAGDVDHGYSQSGKVGYIEGPYEVKTIEAEDLPHEGMGDLLGKPGLFTRIKLTKPAAIDDYKAKLLKPISIGLDTLGKTLTKFKNAIYEISAVSFGACPAAQLLSRDSFAEETVLKLAGIDLNNELRQQDAFRALYTVVDAFTTLVREVFDQNSEGELEGDLDTVLGNLITDFAQALTDRLLPEPTADPEPDPLSGTGSTTMTAEKPTEQPEVKPEDSAQLVQLTAMRTELDRFKQREQIQGLYARVHAKAQLLFAQRKLTPANLAEIEAGAGTTDEVIVKLSAGGTQDPTVVIAALERIEIQLEGLEKFGAPRAEFGSRLSAEPLPNAPHGSTPEQDAQDGAEILKFAGMIPGIF